MREATEAAYLERKPLAIIVDEAHHMSEASKMSRLQSQLNHLKNFENTTGVSHILVGTYEMRPFRKVNPQLALRSVDVHFPRYDMTEEQDCLVFQSILWALQRQLPVEEEPLLAQKHWEFLYARCIGCIGLLKLHLNRALKEGARTVTLDHLRQTAMSDVRVKLALRNALESEAEFVEAENADEQLLTLLRKPLPRPSSTASQGQDEQDQAMSSTSGNRKPGKRAPGRDLTGVTVSEEERREQTDEERAAG
jgi:hypothetical protein